MSHFKSKLELNSKKVKLERCKILSSVFMFISFFFALKAIFQLLQFEFCQIKLRGSTDKHAINRQNFVEVEL